MASLRLLAVAAVIALAGLTVACTVREQIEFGLAQGINGMRSEHGLPPLTRDPQLSAIARARAQDMADNNYFGHTPPDGCDAGCLMERAGMAPGWIGEVIAWNTAPPDQTAGMAIDQWRNSPQHLRVITNGCFTRMGTGTALVADGRIYHVAVFEGDSANCQP